MIDYQKFLDELNEYSKQLGEWFLTGIKPNINLMQLRLELVNNLMHIEVGYNNKFKMIDEIIERIDILIKIGL